MWFVNSNRIYQKTLGSHGAGVIWLAVLGLVGIILGVLVAAVSFSATGWLAGILLVFLILVIKVAIGRVIAQMIMVRRIVKNRQYLGELDLKDKQPAGSRIGASILIEEARAGHEGQKSVASFKAQVIEEGDGWWLYDATSTVYNDKGVAVAERCYTVLEVKLRQATPHLVFDSLRAKGRQFRAIYSGSQRLTGVLGHQFDLRFNTYSPMHHTIETLSFITPEVIEAMLGIDDCDLEFVDNSLFCYAPFLPPDRLDAFQKLGLNLHAKVNDNLRLYQSPERAVKPFGRRLLKSYWQSLVAGIFSLVLAVLAASTALVGIGNPDGDTIGLLLRAVVLGAIGLGLLFSGLKTRAANRRAEQEFLQQAGG